MMAELQLRPEEVEKYGEEIAEKLAAFRVDYRKVAARWVPQMKEQGVSIDAINEGAEIAAEQEFVGPFEDVGYAGRKEFWEAVRPILREEIATAYAEAGQ
jgi:hypothetical protein